jgi:hypothetical protein
MRKFYSLVFALGVGIVSSAQLFTGYSGPTNQGGVPVSPATGGYGTVFTLTQENNLFGQAKGVWANATQSLASNFSVCATLNFGRFSDANPDPAAAAGKRTGADGIAFVLALAGTGVNNPNGNGIYVGETGEEIGYGTSFYTSGYTPRNTIAVEFDTWQNSLPTINGARNLHDPAADHMAFMSRGNADHGVSGTVVSLPELETGTPWNVVLTWNTTTGLSVDLVNPAAPATHYTMSTSVANVLAALGVATTAGTNVNWGFNAGTGLAANQQTVQINTCAVACALTVTAGLPALSCDGPNVIYLGYGPQSVTATSNQAGTTFQWFRQGTPDVMVGTGATFTPTTAGSYYVVGTNGQCTASTEGTAAEIRVIDIRCGTNKVYVCHKQNGENGNGTIGDNAHSLCVSVNAVPAHLAHGDCLGECPEVQGRPGAGTVANQPASELITDEPSLTVYPNPSRGQVQVNLTTANPKAQIYVINSKGTVVEKRTAGNVRSLSFDLKKYGVGVYMVKVVNGNTEQISKVIVQD